MSQVAKWKYYAGYCGYKITKKAGLLGGQEEGYLILALDKEFTLADGLNHMGELGYELVGIQATDMRNGGDVMGWYKPSYFYIFKKPLESPSNGGNQTETTKS